MEDVALARKAVVEWLTKVTASEEANPPVEWLGYMTHMARAKGFVSKATNYIYGPS